MFDIHGIVVMSAITKKSQVFYSSKIFSNVFTWRLPVAINVLTSHNGIKCFISTKRHYIVCTIQHNTFQYYSSWLVQIQTNDQPSVKTSEFLADMKTQACTPL